MVQGKKAFNNSKPKFAEVVIGDSAVSYTHLDVYKRQRCMKWQMLQVPAKQCWPLFVSVNPFKKRCHGLKGSARRCV